MSVRARMKSPSDQGFLHSAVAVRVEGVGRSASRRSLYHHQPASRLLVATDLSERSDIALQRGLHIADELKACLHVLHVVEPGLPRRVTLRRVNEARSVLQGQIDLLAGPSPRDVSISVKIGDPHLEILREAIAQTSDAIVVGPHRRSPAEDQGIVRTSARMLRYSSRPMLFVRDMPAAPYRNAVVDVDLTATSPLVVAACRSLAPSAAVHLIHIYPGEKSAFSDIPNTESRAARLRRVHAFLDHLPWPSVDDGTVGQSASVTLARGPVLDSLGMSAAHRQADLIVIGLRPDNPQDLELALELIRRPAECRPCDVLVVPGPTIDALS